MELEAAISLLGDLGASNLHVRAKSSDGTTEIHCDCLSEITGHVQKDGNSASLNIDKELYKCFSCGSAYNVTQLILYGGLAPHWHAAVEKTKEYTDTIPEVFTYKTAVLEYGEPKDPLYQAEADRFEALAWTNKGHSYLTLPRSEGGRGVPAKFWRDMLVHYVPALDCIRFPCVDHLGRLVGWVDRPLKTGNGPKYINSPGFKKSLVLYGFHQARRELNSRRQKFLLVVEGPGDVIKLHSLGVYNVVSTFGVEFSKDQIYLMSLLTDTVVMAYDNDDAGYKAAYKFIGKTQGTFKQVMLGTYPKGIKDPGEFNLEALRYFLSHLVTPMRTRLETVDRKIQSRFDY